MDRLIDSDYRYLVFGFEEGKKETPHMQGYIYYDHPRRQASVKSVMPRAHLTVCRGTPQENFDYCSKDGIFYEFGEIPTQGKARYEVIADAMLDPEQNFQVYHQYRRSYREYTNSIFKKRERKLYLLKYSDRFDYVTQIDANSVCMSPSDYDGEDVHIVSAMLCNKEKVNLWVRGIPVKEKLGYEFKYYNPEVVVIMYEDDADLRWLKREFIDYIDEIY